MTKSRVRADRITTTTASVGRGPKETRRWLLFVHQLPSHPSNLRVTTWRRLQQLGALPLKQAVYVLPDTPAAREDFEWLKTEVKGSGGDAIVFSADNVDSWSNDAMVEEFRRSRQDAYAALARDVEQALKRTGGTRRPRGTRAPAIRRLLDIFRERLSSIEAIDFFGSAGRDRVVTLLDELARKADPMRVKPPSSRSSNDPAVFTARLWVTRPRPGVDRMSSAWLIRRFIDPQARFAFAIDKDAVPEGGVPFDMFGVDFSHQSGGCTFETLCNVFAIQNASVSRLAAIVHDLDLKDTKFGAPECSTVGATIDGLRLAFDDDEVLLAQGMTLFDSLFRSFEQSARAAGPRPLAKPQGKPRKRKKPRSEA